VVKALESYEASTNEAQDSSLRVKKQKNSQ